MEWLSFPSRVVITLCNHWHFRLGGIKAGESRAFRGSVVCDFGYGYLGVTLESLVKLSRCCHWLPGCGYQRPLQLDLAGQWPMLQGSGSLSIHAKPRSRYTVSTVSTVRYLMSGVRDGRLTGTHHHHCIDGLLPLTLAVEEHYHVLTTTFKHIRLSHFSPVPLYHDRMHLRLLCTGHLHIQSIIDRYARTATKDNVNMWRATGNIRHVWIPERCDI